MKTQEKKIEKLKEWNTELLGIINYLDEKSIVYGVGQMQALQEEIQSYIAALDAQLQSEQKEETKITELIDWLNTECPPGTETADLSHGFAESLIIRLNEIEYHQLQDGQKVSDEDIKQFCKDHPGNLGNFIMDKAVEAGFI